MPGNPVIVVLSIYSFFYLSSQESNSELAQWWGRSLPTTVARVRFPDSASYVGWVCCWFSSLPREVFLWVLRFSPLPSPSVSYVGWVCCWFSSLPREVFLLVLRFSPLPSPSVPYVGWVCCWFSSLLWEVFLRVLRFSPLPSPISLGAICGLSLLLVLFSAPRGFSPGTPVFPSPSKTNISKFQFDPDAGPPWKPLRWVELPG